MKQTFVGAICLSLAASMWGGSYVVSKYIMDDIPPITLVWLRYMTAVVVLLLLLKVIEKKPLRAYRLTKKEGLLLGWIGFIGYFVSIILQFVGTQLSDAHTGSLITSTTPAFMIFFAWLILKERITSQKIAALCLATIGVITVIGGSQYSQSYLTGIFILVGAALTWSLLSIYVKIASEKFSSLFITLIAVFVALILTTPAMIIELQVTPMTVNWPNLLLATGYLGVIATACAFYLWNKGLEYMDASTGSLFFFFQPLVGTLLGWLLLDETLHLNFFIGAGLIIAAVIISIKRFEKREKKHFKPISNKHH